MKIMNQSPEAVTINDSVLNIDKIVPLEKNQLAIHYFKFENGKCTLAHTVVKHHGSKDLILIDKNRKALLEISYPHSFERVI